VRWLHGRGKKNEKGSPGSVKRKNVSLEEERWLATDTGGRKKKGAVYFLSGKKEVPLIYRKERG